MAIKELTPHMEKRIGMNPLLNMDTFIIPSPYILDASIEKDYDHSLIWEEEGEVLGYLLVYADKIKKNFHIYKLVTSPFGRGRGIGQAFISHLAKEIDEDAVVYLYIWEKQADTLDFFQTRGFSLGETIVYRNLVYYHVAADKHSILKHAHKPRNAGSLEANEIGKTRHDARKLVRLLSHMVETLSPENCDKIVEDINRETTTLINMLNVFRDSRKILHEVNLKQVVLKRIIPYVEASPIQCALHLQIDTKHPIILGYYENIGRALVNLVSNSLEAIEELGTAGILRIRIFEEDEEIKIIIRDNGNGIPQEMLKLNAEGIPLFVGQSTKNRKAGEGLGTLQLYSAFGADRIKVASRPGRGTTWQIRFQPSSQEIDKTYVQMDRRFNEFKDLWESATLNGSTSRTDTIAYIWQLRKMEIFLFDLILLFSTYQNIRTIYRRILTFIHGETTEKQFEDYINSLRSDHDMMKIWLYEIAKAIRKRNKHINENIPHLDSYHGAMFKSYGQVKENVIIFTLDPETGNFFATDRKLAEHMDFVAYLKKDKENLLRGEFTGDMNNDEKPIYFGVWSVESDEDLIGKLKLIREGARKLIEMGIHSKKRLAFYQTTYIRHSRDIDTYSTTDFGTFAETTDEGLKKYTRQADEEMFDFIVPVD
ncbi:MAG: GNAT family N-acetyltransferase [Spirochaetales bacterium]|nr:GNAT family N-acetyltransferase [Spirochaetales bacterium]